MNTNDTRNQEPEEGTNLDIDALKGTNHFKEYISDEHKEKSYAEQKFIALYKARYLLARMGTMQERSICQKKLKQMKSKGLSVV